MKKIVYTRPDGGMSVVTPVINTHGEAEGFTEQNAIDRALARIPSDATDIKVVEASAIPADREFRNAWQNTSGVVSIPLAKAKAVTKDRLRIERAPLLAALDAEYLRADEEKDNAAKTEVARKKKLLRDITNLADSATTLAELKAIKAV